MIFYHAHDELNGILHLISRTNNELTAFPTHQCIAYLKIPVADVFTLPESVTDDFVIYLIRSEDISALRSRFGQELYLVERIVHRCLQYQK